MLKAIIADDEKKIVQLIRVLVNWEELGIEVVGTAENGVQAIDLVKELRPDILITDIRMPGCDGLKLIESVHESDPGLRIIIVSGYAHFEYAQQAIRYGVGDYLLKPISKNEINTALRKLCDEINQKHPQTSVSPVQYHNSDKDLQHLRKRLITSLLENDQLSLSADVLRDDYHINVRPGTFQAVCIKMDDPPGKLSDTAREVIYEKITGIFSNTLRPACYEMVSDRRESTIYGVLNYAEGSQRPVRGLVRDCLEQMEAQKGLFPEVVFSISLGCAQPDPQGIVQSFREASVILRERILQGTGHLLETLPCAPEVSWHDQLEEYDRAITSAIAEMDHQKARDASAKARSAVLKKKNISGAQILDFVRQAADILRLRAANLPETAQEQSDPSASEDDRLREAYDQCTSAAALFDLLEARLLQIISSREKAYEKDSQRPVRQARQYIREHFSDPLTLEEVSGAVGLSPAYFSVLFKKESSEGFAKYVNRIRMEEAKRLLRETNLPVTEICNRVGYYDLKHFTNSFEKNAGVKPAVFRKLYG